jgi:hypothetical protein
MNMTLTKEQLAVIYKRPSHSKEEMRKLILENLNNLPQEKIVVCPPSKSRKIR